MADFWDDAINADVEPPPEREDLPAGKWVLAKTATTANGGWAPAVKMQDTKNGTIPKFRVGLICQGGEAGIVKGHTGRYFGFDSFVEPSPEYDGGNPISGKLMGFLNACFAAGVAEGEKDSKARATARWRRTAETLSRYKGEVGSIEEYPSKAVYIAATAAKALEGESRFLLTKTSQRSYMQDGEKKLNPVEAGQIDDYTVTSVVKRKITLAEGEDIPPPVAAAVAKEF